MRIRKNIKLSSIMPPEMLQTYVCQLNQSPWDVISETSSFSLTDPSEDEEDTVSDSEMFFDETDDIEGSATSLMETQEKFVPDEEEDNENNQSIINTEEVEIYNKRDQTNDGSNELEHSHEARQNGLIIKNSELAATKFVTKADGWGHPRLINTAGAASTCTEFYYYSGFGPFRDKKRDEAIKDITNCSQNKSSFSEIECLKAVYQLDGDDHENGFRKLEVINVEKKEKAEEKRIVRRRVA